MKRRRLHSLPPQLLRLLLGEASESEPRPGSRRFAIFSFLCSGGFLGRFADNVVRIWRPPEDRRPPGRLRCSPAVLIELTRAGDGGGSDSGRIEDGESGSHWEKWEKWERWERHTRRDRMEDGKSKEEWGQEEWIRLQRWQASDSALFALYLKIAFYFFEVRATSYLFFKPMCGADSDNWLGGAYKEGDILYWAGYRAALVWVWPSLRYLTRPATWAHSNTNPGTKK